MSGVVRAAGGVPVRRVGDDREVLIIHRARYGDWTLPKGKCEPAETDEACALREVEEETGLVCALGEELGETEYVDSRGRPKRVRYWALVVVAGDAHPAPPEVDTVLWLPLAVARERLTHEHDRALLDVL